MTYTAEQIAAAARLVPEYAAVFHYSDGEMEIVQKGTLKKWQPWADTEAGRSDALGLLAAVVSRLYVMDGPTFHTLAHHEGGVNDALISGNIQKIQQATMAAAVAIGEFLTGEEGK